MSDSILNPDNQIILADNTSVTVKLLKWKTALVFFDKLNDQFKTYLTETAQGPSMTFDMAKVMAALKTHTDLLEWLVKECTGKDDAWLENITLGDMAAVAVKAVEINLVTVAQEIKNVKSRLVAMASTGATPAAVPNKSSETSPPSVT